MPTILVVGFLVGAGAVHLQTGRSIFHWGARICIVLDASLICAYRITLRAAAAWWQRLPRVIAEVRLEVVR
jgi:hypothetical protein